MLVGAEVGCVTGGADAIPMEFLRGRLHFVKLHGSGNNPNILCGLRFDLSR